MPEEMFSAADTKVQIALERLSVQMEGLSVQIKRLSDQQDKNVNKDDYAKLEKKVEELQAEKGHWFDRVAAGIISAVISIGVIVASYFIQK